MSFDSRGIDTARPARVLNKPMCAVAGYKCLPRSRANNLGLGSSVEPNTHMRKDK